MILNEEIDQKHNQLKQLEIVKQLKKLTFSLERVLGYYIAKRLSGHFLEQHPEF